MWQLNSTLLKPMKTRLPTSQGPWTMLRWAMELNSPMVTAAPDLEWMTTPS